MSETPTNDLRVVDRHGHVIGSAIVPFAVWSGEPYEINVTAYGVPHRVMLNGIEIRQCRDFGSASPGDVISQPTVSFTED